MCSTKYRVCYIGIWQSSTLRESSPMLLRGGKRGGNCMGNTQMSLDSFFGMRRTPGTCARDIEWECVRIESSGEEELTTVCNPCELPPCNGQERHVEHPPNIARINDFCFEEPEADLIFRETLLAVFVKSPSKDARTPASLKCATACSGAMTPESVFDCRFAA